jgi:5-(carboxyamino)imidazole ribonucleotide mutase
MKNQRLIVIMGSKSDFPFANQIGIFLKKENFSLKCEYNVSSAHKTPELILKKLRKFEESNDSIIYITIAGLSDALSGVVAGFSVHPVIACPPDIERFGWSKMFSSFMTPKGISVLLSPNPENAALAAIKIFACTNSSLKKEFLRYMKKKRDAVINGDKEIIKK